MDPWHRTEWSRAIGEVELADPAWRARAGLAWSEVRLYNDDMSNQDLGS